MRKISKQELNRVDPNIKNLHPKYQLLEIFNIVGKVGSRNFLYGADYGRERDLLIGCMFAFYCRRIQNREWFIQRVKDPPDFSLLAPTNRLIKEKPFDYAEIEVVQIPPRINDYSEVIKTLNNTKLNVLYSKAVDRDTVLLIFVNNANGPVWSDELIIFFESSNDSFGQVFAIYLLAVNLKESFVYEIKSLRPSGSREILKLNDEVKKPMIWHPYFDKFAVKVE